LLFAWIKVVISGFGLRVAIVEYYDFVNAEDSKGSGDGANDGGFEIMCLCTISN